MSGVASSKVNGIHEVVGSIPSGSTIYPIVNSIKKFANVCFPVPQKLPAERPRNGKTPQN